MGRADALLVSLMLGITVPVSAQESGRMLTTLWVWHGDHDLRGLHRATDGEVSVAYLARTIRIVDNRLEVHPRRGSLLLDPETNRTAVVRIEVQPRTTAGDFRSMQTRLLQAVEPVFREPGVSGLQIDFDAPSSFRRSYAELLDVLRDHTPEGWTLEMTALGSWCAQDRWLRDVAVDRIVPMLFGPGHEQGQLFAALRHGPLPEPRCRESHGIREGNSLASSASTVFVFPRAPWTLARAVTAWEHRQAALSR